MSELSHESLALLARARRGEIPPRGAREAGKQRLAVALGVAAAGAAVTTTGAAAAPVAAVFTLKSTIVYLVVGLASGGVVTGASFMVGSSSRSEVSRAAATKITPAGGEGVRELPAIGERAPAALPAPFVDAGPGALDLPMNPLPSPPRSSGSASADANARREPAVSAGEGSDFTSDATRGSKPARADSVETSGLVAAQQALRSGDASLALARLDEHARLFPQSRFDEERSAARIVALCSLGRSHEARALLRAFTERFPASPATPRVTAACR